MVDFYGTCRYITWIPWEWDKDFFRYTIDTSTGKCTLQAAQEVKDVWAVACKKLHVDHTHRACGENMLLSKVSWENPWVEYLVVVKN